MNAFRFCGADLTTEKPELKLTDDGKCDDVVVVVGPKQTNFLLYYNLIGSNNRNSYPCFSCCADQKCIEKKNGEKASRL